MRISIICAAGGLYYAHGNVKQISFLLEKLGWNYDRRGRKWFTADKDKANDIRLLGIHRSHAAKLFKKAGFPYEVDRDAFATEQTHFEKQLRAFKTYFCDSRTVRNLELQCTEKVEYFDTIYYAIDKKPLFWHIVHSTCQNKFWADVRFCKVLEAYQPIKVEREGEVLEQYPTIGSIVDPEALINNKVLNSK